LFLGYFWKAENAILEIKDGYPDIEGSKVSAVWVFFIKYICPLLIGIVLITTIVNFIS
jgi:NSS family neurotransmitter:Na+ symporter